MDKNARIYVAGHRGLIGSAVMRQLTAQGYGRLLVADHSCLELTDSAQVDSFFLEYKPEYVILAAGRVGGIVENQTHPADFITENLSIQLNVLRAAHHQGVAKLILFASSCMYPRECTQPMAEDALFSGKLEPTSLAYAVAKLAGMQMCLAYNQQFGEHRYIPLIPNSVFGPNDNFDPRSGHVLSALICRFHEAKVRDAAEITLWGSGTPRREFVYADDIAQACINVLAGDSSCLQLPVNVGTGRDQSIYELAEVVSRVVGYSGKVLWDRSKPDGVSRKLLDSSRMRTFGWKPTIDLEQGIRQTYEWYLENALQAAISP